MNKEEALKHLHNMQYTIQKVRSINEESGMVSDKPIRGLGLTPEAASYGWKYVWGKNCILPSLSKVIDKWETGIGEPIDFYNMMFIAIELEPLIGMACGVTDPTFPKEMSITWLSELREDKNGQATGRGEVLQS